jgi:hypothetical protein
LAEMTGNGRIITVEVAQRVQPALRLQTALANTPQSDPEATVMAAVRAIEHCNTWIAPRGALHWNDFINDYLLDEYTVTAFANRVVHDVFAGVAQHRPDRTRGAVPPAELAAIREDITVPGSGMRFDRLKMASHVNALKNVYADHWLARRLDETADIMSTGATLNTAFDVERQRVQSRVKRLTRCRNAAIHGGPLSDVACETIADFATALAREALNTTIWGIVTGQPVDVYATSRRDESRQRIRNLARDGDLANLFRLTP